MAAKVRNRRRAPRRKNDALVRLELDTLREDLAASTQRVTNLERTLKTLFTEVDRLHEKMRS
jgi:hypothetical protein